MRVEPLGDGAFILRDLAAPAWQVAEALSSASGGIRIPGLVEAVASYDTVGVYGDIDPQSLTTVALHPQTIRTSRCHLIPVCYDLGEDLAEAAAELHISEDELITVHSSAVYTCYAVGFCPGFAYLGYVPDAIAGLPRRAIPRVRVEPGSVGLTGRQTAAYPLPRPGGWMLIGRTPLTLVDVADEYFPIEAGDQVRFSPIAQADFQALLGQRLEVHRGDAEGTADARSDS